MKKVRYMPSWASRPTEYYIGSTCRRLNQRWVNHKSDYKSYQKGSSHYLTSFKVMKYEDAYIQLIEEFPCENKQQLHKREGYHILNTKNCVNRFVAGRTREEFYQENKEKILNERRKRYRNQNERKRREQKFCKCGGSYRNIEHDTIRHLRSNMHQIYLDRITDDFID